MRKIHIIGNWKMNHDLDSCLNYCSNIHASTENDKVIAGIAPPFPLLGTCIENLPANFKISGQNCHTESGGAYTGEVSPQLLKSIGCSSVILGHSERRMYHGESDEIVLAKTRNAIEAQLRVIFCCGEPLEVRDAATHKEFVSNQLANSISMLNADEIKKVIIAYEPIWAIGTGRTASADQAEEMCSFIRSKINETFGENVADSIIILYGGSVKPANCIEIFSKQNVDGGLVGGASLKPTSFNELLELSASL